MKTGRLSVLIGAHQFLIHPLFLAAAWARLYGFPTDPRLWVAFFVHDLGYWNCQNMDDEQGERHVELGARWMARWFDSTFWALSTDVILYQDGTVQPVGPILYGPETDRLDDVPGVLLGPWGQLALFHSRFYAKAANMPPSRLCAADKLAMSLEPWWVYLPRVLASGEVWEYVTAYNFGKYRADVLGHGQDPVVDVSLAELEARRLTRRTWTAIREWHTFTQGYLRRWAYDHAQDTDAPHAFPRRPA